MKFPKRPTTYLSKDALRICDERFHENAKPTGVINDLIIRYEQFALHILAEMPDGIKHNLPLVLMSIGPFIRRGDVPDANRTDAVKTIVWGAVMRASDDQELHRLLGSAGPAEVGVLVDLAEHYVAWLERFKKGSDEGDVEAASEYVSMLMDALKDSQGSRLGAPRMQG